MPALNQHTCLVCQFCGNPNGYFRTVGDFRRHLRFVHGFYGAYSQAIINKQYGSIPCESSQHRSAHVLHSSTPQLGDFVKKITRAVSAGVSEGVREGIIAVSQYLAANSSDARLSSGDVRSGEVQETSNSVQFDTQLRSFDKRACAGLLTVQDLERLSSPLSQLVITDQLEGNAKSEVDVISTVKLPVGENPDPVVIRYEQLLEKYGDEGPADSHEDRISWCAAYAFNNQRLLCLDDLQKLTSHILTLLDLKVDSQQFAGDLNSVAVETSASDSDLIVSSSKEDAHSEEPDALAEDKMPPLVPSDVFQLTSK